MPAEEPRRKEPSGWALMSAKDLMQKLWDESKVAWPTGEWHISQVDIALALDAARAKGMEEAAKVCDARSRGYRRGVGAANAARLCAAAIRALARKEGA